ncbi:MAG: hypothetical protein SGBAC_011912 [Bacillariaceae sp.]
MSSSIPMSLLLLSLMICATQALSPSSLENGISRRGMLQQGGASVAAVASVGFLPSIVVSATTEIKPKLTNLSNDELTKIITEDVTKRQFLASADLTREIYDESAMFTDEIDTYTLDKWIKGTKALFVAPKSEVTLTPDTLKVTDSEVTFKFSEYLCFNIPFKPVVYLSGTMILKRDTLTGLITSYQEIWDQDVNTVLKSAKFG